MESACLPLLPIDCNNHDSALPRSTTEVAHDK